MRSKKPFKPARSFFLLSLLGRGLILLGTPSMFFLKALVWSSIWFGQIAILFIIGLINILHGTLTTLFWTGQTFSGALNLLIRNLSPKVKSVYKKIFFASKKVSTEISSVLETFQAKILILSKREFPKWKPRIVFPTIPSIKWPKFSLSLPKRAKNFKRGRPIKIVRPIWQQKISYGIFGAVFCFIFLFVPYWFNRTLSELPSPYALKSREIPVATKIYDRNGILLYQFYADENRTIVALDSLPKNLINATIAIEDRNFYKHTGFDIQGIGRAVIANSNGSIVQGGSTITQQLIKSALLTPKQNFERKLKELVLSVWAERIYTKKQILEMYFNQVPYGGTAYGIKAASQTYFNKEPKDLTLAQSALLAGLPSSPSNYSPFGPHPELSKERQRQVLTAMLNQGYITKEEAETATKEDLRFVSPETSIKAPHFVMYVKDYLVQKYGSRLVEQGGLEVYTTLDYPTYEMASKIVKEGVEKQKYLRVGNGAALITNPQTGEILAMVGSKDFFDLNNDGNVNVTISPRSPGSSIKPLNYALALEKGYYTPSSIISDSLTSFKIPGSAPYIPRNYDNRTSGNVTFRVALARSLNIPAVKVLEKNGVGNFIEFAQKMGLTTLTDTDRFGLSLTLGGGETLMTDMATAYGSFANGGERIDLKPVLYVKDYKGQVLEDNKKAANKERVMTSQTAFLISDILSDDNARSGTFGRGSILNIPGHSVAVKTGTTENKRDNWTIGYTPSYVVAVWVGNNDNSLMSPALESGNTGAAAIWNPIFSALLKDKQNESFVRPDNVVAVQVCAINGLLPCENCPSIRTEFFAKGTEPKVACKISKEDLEKFNKPENKQ